ncbi:MAG TPA: ABC transporter permease, partial [Bacteroidales bacterium]|nr:ABC transporter permease [Bacteroidales bacterium]
MAQTIITENIRISLNSIRSHLLRTILTIMIIAFGIMALVGILTATDSIKYYLTQNFSMMGSNTFTIRNRSMQVHIGGGDQSNKPRLYEPITYQQATEFKEKFSFPGTTSVFTFATGIATLKFANFKTNPNVRVMGTDENYPATSG